MKVNIKTKYLLILLIIIFNCDILNSQVSSSDPLKELLKKIEFQLEVKSCEILKDSIENYFYSDLIEHNIEYINLIRSMSQTYRNDHKYEKKRGGDYCKMIMFKIDALLYSIEYKNFNNNERFSILYSKLLSKVESKLPYTSEAYLLTSLFNTEMEETFFEKYKISNPIEKSILIDIVINSSLILKKNRFMERILLIETSLEKIKTIKLFKKEYEKEIAKINNEK